MQLDLTPLEKACSFMQEAVANAGDQGFVDRLNASQHRLIMAGVIQNFEFCYELCWKFIKRWLSENIGRAHVDGVSRRELFRLAAESRLIDDVDLWMGFHADRNRTAHIYDQETAQEVYASSVQFVPFALDLLQTLKAKND